MKRLMLLAGAVALLVAAPAPARTAKTVAVDITKAGFASGAVTVQVGDSVTWTNKDTASHQVICATCPFNSPALSAGQTFTYPFAKAGKYTVVDPLNKNKKMTVTVAAASATVSVAAGPRVLDYGAATTISGTLSTAQANQKVDILAQACGENAPKAVGTVTTTTGGAFSFQTKPTLNTGYQVRFGSGANAVTSALVPVSTRAIVTLRRNALHRFTVQVIAAQSFVGKAATFQRWVQRKHRWSRVKTVFLGSRHAASAPLAGSTVSAVTFGARIPRGLKVRALLPSGQAGPCYIAAKSATVRS
ncbi:MAG: cupredoxin domain-containing protein [Gaiellaceae bacterium]|jgi:plastocyanin